MNLRVHKLKRYVVRRPGRHDEGTSLIVMIALVAILSIFAVALLRALLREIDVEVARQEVSTLRAYQQAFQSGILREGYIPHPNNWALMVATNTGAHTNEVAVNKRGRDRVLMVDPRCTVP